MDVIKFLGFLAATLPAVYGAPTQTENSLEPHILHAMKRDLGLDAEQATARVAREISASNLIEHLRSSTGDAFAGAWVSDSGRTIHVGVTDDALVEEITAAGATPVILANSLSKLEEAKNSLDALVDEPSTLDTTTAGVTAWFVDVVSNKVIFEAVKGSTTRAEELAALVGLSESEFEVQTVDEVPLTYATIRGGDPFLVNGSSRCSIGFTVTTGFITAGHCGRQGDTATTLSGELLGTFANSIYPGSGDMAWVRTVAGHTLSGTVGNNIRITGSTAAPVGASICRYGSTTGTYCGTVRQINVTVNYAEGRVTGLTNTSVCSEPGSSGSPMTSGSQAQGVVSGGSGSCSSGGTTYFQPVNRILSTYGLTLVTS
jgi:hypothetical protein